MAQQLLSNNQMKAVRGVALLGMTTPITIERRSEAAPPVGGDYGDDFIQFNETTESVRLNIKGWFFSTPAAIQDVDTGMVITTNTYRLFVPVGTDVRPGDHVTVKDLEFTVSDTTAEGTWLPLLTVNLRKRE